MKQNVGFMGLGIMGAAMAANIRNAGYPLRVYNRTASKAAALNFGHQGGLALETMLDVVLSGPLSRGLFQTKAEMVTENHFPANFPLKHMTKDCKFIVDTAYDTGAPVLLGQVLLHLYRCVGPQS